MKKPLTICSMLCLLPAALLHAGEWTSLFDGKTLDGWKGNPVHWSVEDGVIKGVNPEDKAQRTKGNTFLVWQGGEVADFELKFSYKINTGNSGVQYRSKLVNAEKFVVAGYQADFESGTKFSGINYGEKTGRGILANRGQKVTYPSTGEKKVETISDSAEIQKHIKSDDWNEYHVTAKGPHMIHKINGVVTSELIDQHPKAVASGIIAIQVHAGPAMQVFVKDVQLLKIK